MEKIINEIKLFAIIYIFILIIVICLLSKYFEVKNINYENIEYTPDSKTTLILEEIRK